MSLNKELLYKYMEKQYVTSKYLEGGLTEMILSSGGYKNTPCNNYSQYYTLSHLIEYGIDTIRSPHSNKKMQINKRLIKTLQFFRYPKSIREFFEANRADFKMQNLIVSLIEGKFIFPTEVDQDRCFNLLYVEIDPNTVCNQSCVYCPVSIHPRKRHEMNEGLFDDILSQIESLNNRNNITVFLTAYNEATIDKRYARFVKKIKERGLNHIVVSNGSNLNPSLVDTLVGIGIKEFFLNIPSIDRDQYYKLRGTQDIDRIIRNVDYLSLKPVKVTIISHGTGDLNHYKNFKALKKRFQCETVSIAMGKTMDRAGIMGNEYKLGIRRERLLGCMNHGSRLINWIHVNSKGECFLCPMDYYYKYIIGDLNKNSLEEVLCGDMVTLYRRYLYGIESAPTDFICNKCIASIPTTWAEITEKDMVRYSYRKNYLRMYLKKKFKSLSLFLPLYLKDF